MRIEFCCDMIPEWLDSTRLKFYFRVSKDCNNYLTGVDLMVAGIAIERCPFCGQPISVEVKGV